MLQVGTKSGKNEEDPDLIDDMPSEEPREGTDDAGEGGSAETSFLEEESASEWTKLKGCKGRPMCSSKGLPAARKDKVCDRTYSSGDIDWKHPCYLKGEDCIRE